MAARLSAQPPDLAPPLEGVPPSPNGVPFDGVNFAVPHFAQNPPRPPGLDKHRRVDMPHPVNAPIPDGDPVPDHTLVPDYMPIPDNGPLRHPLDPRIISPQKLFWVMVTLLAAILLLVYDPFVVILDVESAKRHASVENATLAFEKEKTEREREVMVRERELWQKAKEARLPHSAFWDGVWPAWDCRAYGKREYWGILSNIPKDWDPIDACMNMPVEIKGVKIRHPDRCRYANAFSSVVHGYWMVDWDQPDCKPWYRDFEDKGCTGYNSGKRRIQAEIVGINDKGEQDWKLLCGSTPLVWDMTTYESPTRCEERSWGRKIAIWDVPDERCLS